MPITNNHSSLSQDPRDRVGVYKSIDEVPEKYHLQNYEAAYDGRDVWASFADYKMDRDASQATEDRVKKTERYWKSHMNDRHHALADPSHVENFLIAIRDGQLGRQTHSRQLHTIYYEYYLLIEQFYTWLQWHTDHPHVYHPVIMAAIDGGLASKVFDYKINQNDKR